MTPMTILGYELLRRELERLESEERPKITSEIAEARSFGDFKENAEYHAAKEKQGFIEARIAEIKSKLATAQVIDVTKLPHDGRVVFGATVTLRREDSGTSVTYRLVGDDEANLEKGNLSILSPLARALIGKEAGDAVIVRAPQGEIEYEIETVMLV